MKKRNISPQEFKRLTYNEKVIITKARATYLMDRSYGPYIIGLYSLDGFLFEVWVEKFTKEIERFQVISNEKKAMDLFAEEIPSSQLLMEIPKEFLKNLM